MGEREVTDLLGRNGLPFNPLRFDAIASKRSGSARQNGRRWARPASPPTLGVTDGLWRSEAKFHWQQTFPPGLDVRIAHSYAPVSGFGLLDRKEASRDADRATYCLDVAGPDGIRRLPAKASDAGGYLRAFVVPYLVTTARSWAAPIGRFTLAVDKGSPEAVVSFCRAGVRKVGPATFRWKARDHVPDQDLRVLIVQPGPGPSGIR
ncbi:DUF4424 family protein [Methylobacterium sp. CM6257]